jgi:hypothetical protein
MDFTMMFTRFRDCAEAVFGPCARIALDVLFATLSVELYPVIGDDLRTTTLAPAHAIDVTNHCLYQIGHNASLRQLSQLERWLPPMTNVTTTAVWKKSLHLQTIATIQAMAVTAAAATTTATKRKTAPAATDSSGRKNASKRTRGRSISSAPTSSAPTTVTTRCILQDKPGGCSFGLRCKFAHDADNPKTDAGRGASRK